MSRRVCNSKLNRENKSPPPVQPWVRHPCYNVRTDDNCGSCNIMEVNCCGLACTFMYVRTSTRSEFIYVYLQHAMIDTSAKFESYNSCEELFLSP